MKAKRKIQIAIDALMTCVLLILMSYSVAGELLHEILGISMFVLLTAHHILSFPYTKALLKGRPSATKIIKAALDILLCLNMLVMMFSGIILSKHIFAFLEIGKLSGLGRTLHLLGSYWGFAFMSIHLGFHLEYVFSKALKSKKGRRAFIAVLSLMSAAGLFFFITEGIYKYMLLINRFVFFDADGGVVLFLLKYIPIMFMYAFAGYTVNSILKKSETFNKKGAKK